MLPIRFLSAYARAVSVDDSREANGRMTFVVAANSTHALSTLVAYCKSGVPLPISLRLPVRSTTPPGPPRAAVMGGPRLEDHWTIFPGSILESLEVRATAGERMDLDMEFSMSDSVSSPESLSEVPYRVMTWDDLNVRLLRAGMSTAMREFNMRVVKGGMMTGDMTFCEHMAETSSKHDDMSIQLSGDELNAHIEYDFANASVQINPGIVMYTVCWEEMERMIYSSPWVFEESVGSRWDEIV